MLGSNPISQYYRSRTFCRWIHAPLIVASAYKLTWVISILVDAPAVPWVDDGPGMVDGVAPLERRSAASATDSRCVYIHRALAGAARFWEFLRPSGRTCKVNKLYKQIEPPFMPVLNNTSLRSRYGFSNLTRTKRQFCVTFFLQAMWTLHHLIP